MPDQFAPDFEHGVLEADIKRLAEEVQKHRETPEMRTLSGHELLKKSLQSLTPPPPPPTPSEQPQGGAASPLPSYAQNAPAETKLEIEYLLDMAFHQGIMKANAEAAKSTPFVLDAFHDAVVGKLYPEFQKRGILK